MKRRAGLILSLMLTTLVADQVIKACAPAPRLGATVTIAEESAVIVWEARTRTEHFIRRASFDTDSADFGFLVPTPTRPALAEAKDEAFNHLWQLMRPEIISREETRVDFTPLVLLPFLALGEKAGAPAPTAKSVRVLDVQRVAGYDAVVLEADDANALTEWLRKREYASSPELAEWLAPYVAKKWKITAFKIAKDSSGKQVSTSAVRMSFQSDRPFFPYREPAERKPAQKPARLLQVLFLGDARMEGAIGESAPARWPGRVNWAGSLKESERESLARELALSTDQLPEKLWLTAFEDASSPRPGTADLYFSESADQTPALPPPMIVTPTRLIRVPADVIFILIAMPVAVILLLRRRKRNSTSA
ncbi:MAG: DUF2330 domain-containing protein [Acidobacteriota bacterium]